MTAPVDEDVRRGPAPPHVKRYRDFWALEVSAAWLYRELAKDSEPESAATLEKLANGEDRHAAHWRDLVAEAGYDASVAPPIRRRERLLALVARRFGVQAVLKMLVRFEAAEARRYVAVPEAPESMAAEEVRHGRTLAGLGTTGASGIARREARHRSSAGGALRAATFGVNDGLVSNLALVIGVAAAAPSGNSNFVLVAGVAGLIAGAMSMAAGEWVSVRSQRELYEREIDVEAEELAAFPDEEREELQLIYEAKGLTPAAASEIANRIIGDPQTALETLTREELGLDPNELGSPWIAASSSFVSFAAGATIPVVPFIFTTGARAMTIAAVLSGLVLAAVGASIALLTGRGYVRSALRMVAIGGFAAAITYGVGRLLGVTVN